MAAEFVWTIQSPTDRIILRPESIWDTDALAMSVTRIVEGEILIGTLIETATATTAGAVVEATVEIEIAILMAATVVTGVTSVVRGQVGEGGTPLIMTTGAEGVIHEAPRVEVVQPEAEGILMLLLEHLRRRLLPTRLRCLDGKWVRFIFKLGHDNKFWQVASDGVCKSQFKFLQNFRYSGLLPPFNSTKFKSRLLFLLVIALQSLF